MSDDLSVRFFESGCLLLSVQESKDLAERLEQLSEQSMYAPTHLQISGFLKDVFFADGKKLEKSLLGILVAADSTVQGFIECRYFEETADLDFVLIDSALRGRGLGRFLIENMETRLKEVRVAKMFLEVGINNISAIQLYRKLGYSDISMRKAYYRNGEDALVMGKEL